MTCILSLNEKWSLPNEKARNSITWIDVAVWKISQTDNMYAQKIEDTKKGLMHYCLENKIWNDDAHSGIGYNTTFLSYYLFIELGSFKESHPRFYVSFLTCIMKTW